MAGMVQIQITKTRERKAGFGRSLQNDFLAPMLVHGKAVSVLLNGHAPYCLLADIDGDEAEIPKNVESAALDREGRRWPGGVSLETGGLDGTTACSPVSYVPSPFTQAPRAITLLVTLLVTLDIPRGGA